MRSHRLLLTVLLSVIFVSTSYAYLEFRVGRTYPLSSLDNRFDGGIFVSLGGEAPLFERFSLAGDASFARLGRNKPFTYLLAKYAERAEEDEQHLPWGPLIEALDIGSISLSIGFGVRYYPVKRKFFEIYAEPGVNYVWRAGTIRGIPLDLIGKQILDINITHSTESGFGFYSDFGAHILPFIPLFTGDLGVRLLVVPGLGRSPLDENVERNVKGYTAPKSDNLVMVSFYLGANLF